MKIAVNGLTFQMDLDGVALAQLHKLRWHSLHRRLFWFDVIKGRREYHYLHREIMRAKDGQYVVFRTGNHMDYRKTNLELCNKKKKVREQRRETTMAEFMKGARRRMDA